MSVLSRAGYSESEINGKIRETLEAVFAGEHKFYHESGDKAYLTDTGNDDVRTEGQSYGMMIAVQMNRKDVFDKIWNWTHTYMFQRDGKSAGYFGWSAKLDGTLNSTGPAPDGEEFFAMSLLFAEKRWGNGEGIYNYGKAARELLREMVHKTGFEMFDPETKLIRFTPGSAFSDPSYHLPHFYELFAEWGNEADRGFFKDAARLSREYLHKACHPSTGLSAEYAEYDGTPVNQGNHGLFFSDAYRTGLNIALDWLWFGRDSWQRTQAANIQNFYANLPPDGENFVYAIDGTPVTDRSRLAVFDEGQTIDVLHPLGLLATLAASSAANPDEKTGNVFARKFFTSKLRTDKRRYYDNLLYVFALLLLSGNYRREWQTAE